MAICWMTWEQFLVLLSVFQKHLYNVHHIEVILIGIFIGIPALILGVLYWRESRKVRKVLEDIADALRKR